MSTARREDRDKEKQIEREAGRYKEGGIQRQSKGMRNGDREKAREIQRQEV